MTLTEIVFTAVWGCGAVGLVLATIAARFALRDAPRNRVGSHGGWLTVLFDRSAFRGKALRYRAWTLRALGVACAAWILGVLIGWLGL